jgi:hypothetical protein
MAMATLERFNRQRQRQIDREAEGSDKQLADWGAKVNRFRGNRLVCRRVLHAGPAARKLKWIGGLSMKMDTNRNAEGQEGEIALSYKERGTLMTPQLNEKDQSQTRPASDRIVQRNRQNARKSTGPKTQKGKEQSRWNAVTHGLCVKNHRVFPFKENQEELRKLYARLVNDRQPVGDLEESCVEQIAMCLWKRKRAWNAENAEIRLGEEDILEKVRDLHEGQLMTQGDRIVMALLRSAEREIESIGELSEDLKAKIFAAGPQLPELWPDFQEAAEEAAEERDQESANRIAKEKRLTVDAVKKVQAINPTWQRERARFVALTTIEGADWFMRQAYEPARQLSERRLLAEFGRREIPDYGPVDKIIRYAAANERELHRAVDILEDLQRRRKGEPVLPR